MVEWGCYTYGPSGGTLPSATFTHVIAQARPVDWRGPRSSLVLVRPRVRLGGLRLLDQHGLGLSSPHEANFRLQQF